ncbi:MAG: beta-galactosidase, partial [Terrimicrobiaceae bacterium]|nr:beta-galactosidase [Terrimicrobiaceae bacterium]
MNSKSSVARVVPGFHAILHGADYNPEQWLSHPEALAEDRRLRKLAGCNVFSIGIFSWSHLEPEEGRFEFEWLDRVMDELAEDGCIAILATPTAARPPWLARRYPEVMRVGRPGLREPFQTRHNFCWSSPVFREKALEIITRLAGRYRCHPALGMWHISNELGGNEGNGECFCPRCLAGWHAWLRDRYGTLEALNEAWWGGFWAHRYSDWEEINPGDPTLDACGLDWSRFVNWQMRGWFEFEAGIIRPITPDTPITTNFMGIHPWIDYAEFGRVVDVVADDQYPGFHVGRESLMDGFLACAFTVSYTH